VIAWIRHRRGLTLRALSARAATSHSALAAYEQRRVCPTTDTVDRVVRAAGFRHEPHLVRSIDDPDRGAELVAILQLAAAFPARHHPNLTFPPFGRAADHVEGHLWPTRPA
jgi:transcriptional regulator with XRE-family HTH domain